MEQGDIVSNERPSKAVLRAVEAVQANIDTVVESMMEDGLIVTSDVDVIRLVRSPLPD